MSNAREQLLDSAESRIRAAGYHAVSFRDLAADLGIKSASVHYHFPKKEDLGAAVVKRYGERFFAALEEATGPEATPAERLKALVAAFRQALAGSDRVCLCGIMGAEAHGLPEPVRKEVAGFLRAVGTWAGRAHEEAGIADPQARGEMMLSALQGAMILAVNLSDIAVFDRVAGTLLREAGISR